MEVSYQRNPIGNEESGHQLKRQHAQTLNEAKEAVERLNFCKIQGDASIHEHQEWIKARQVVLEGKEARIDRLRLLLMEKVLKNKDAFLKASSKECLGSKVDKALLVSLKITRERRL